MIKISLFMVNFILFFVLFIMFGLILIKNFATKINMK